MADETYTVQRSTTIDARPEHVYEQIADFHNWPKWSPWEGVDPQLKRWYSGAGSGAGAGYTWSGNRRAGQGRMEITNATQPSSVRIDLQFEKPWKSRNDLVFTIQPEGTGSRVTWTMTGRKTLMTQVMGVFRSMDKLIGPDFEKGLAQLKAVTEQRAATD
ncbi:MAG: SRPBCC family protein [Jiangellaceae bacterium]|nr:SRPBCC family protein [Jiangellaceae bacterium]